MSKKVKIMYFALMAVNAILCIFNVVAGEYTALVVNGITLAWLINTYILVQRLHYAHAELERLYNELYESAKRESIRQQEFNKMRERAQNAEKQLQQIINDTPARGKDGRFVKRG